MEINAQAGCHWRLGKPVLFKTLKADTLHNHSTGKQVDTLPGTIAWVCTCQPRGVR